MKQPYDYLSWHVGSETVALDHPVWTTDDGPATLTDLIGWFAMVRYPTIVDDSLERKGGYYRPERNHDVRGTLRAAHSV